MDMPDEHDTNNMELSHTTVGRIDEIKKKKKRNNV